MVKFNFSGPEGQKEFDSLPSDAKEEEINRAHAEALEELQTKVTGLQARLEELPEEKRGPKFEKIKEGLSRFGELLSSPEGRTLIVGVSSTSVALIATIFGFCGFPAGFLVAGGSGLTGMATALEGAVEALIRGDGSESGQE